MKAQPPAGSERPARAGICPKRCRGPALRAHRKPPFARAAKVFYSSRRAARSGTPPGPPRYPRFRLRPRRPDSPGDRSTRARPTPDSRAKIGRPPVLGAGTQRLYRREPPSLSRPRWLSSLPTTALTALHPLLARPRSPRRKRRNAMPYPTLRSWLNRLELHKNRARGQRKPGIESLEERQLLATAAWLANVLHLDFGTATSPVMPGSERALPVASTKAAGYGWMNTTGLRAVDRGSDDALTRDYHRGRNNTFVADVSNGTYQVTALLGGLLGPTDRVDIVAEGQPMATNV